MKEEIKIRDARPEDAEGMTNVFYKTWLETYPSEELGITVEDIKESFKDSFSDKEINALADRIKNLSANEKRIVAESEGKIVGTATMVRKDENNFLQTIYVLPEFQGRGIGKKFWEELLAFCDPTKDIVVHVATHTPGAIEFYKKLGFVDTGKRLPDKEVMPISGVAMTDMEMIIKK